MDNIQPACAHCAFVDLAEGGGNICRRNPPTSLVVMRVTPGMRQPEPSVASAFPPVGPTDWCGEFITPEELAAIQAEQMGSIPPLPQAEM